MRANLSVLDFPKVVLFIDRVAVVGYHNLQLD